MADMVWLRYDLMAAKWPHLWRPAVPNDARRDRSEDARLVRKGDENVGTASCAQ